MKKHLFGLALFSLIVGSAIVVKAIFFAPIYKFDVIRNMPENSCWKMKKETVQALKVEDVKTTKPMIRQAVFDLNTKQMDWDLIVPKNTSSIALHFFVKDTKGARYLKTEFAPSTSLNKTTTDSEVLEFTSSYMWLDKLGTYQNLYIVPEAISWKEFRRMDIKPVFDETSATSVLLYSGQAGYPTERYFRK